MITVWTVGHSTRSAEEFGQMLVAHGIKVLVDVRMFPGFVGVAGCDWD
jgi:uncharacterized protein (DUF488 family)